MLQLVLVQLLGMFVKRGVTLYNGLERDVYQFFKFITAFLMAVIIVMIMFVVQGYCAFGTQVQQFFTVYDSVLSALKILTNNFDVQSFEPSDKLFTFFFFVFTSAMNFVLLSMLVMIVFYGYFFVDIQTKRKVGKYNKVYLFMESKFPKIGLNKLATWLRNNRLKHEMQSDLITYWDVRKMLKRLGLTDLEVENKLKSYDVKTRKTLHIDTAIQIFENVLQQIDDQINEESESSQKYGEQATAVDSNNTEWMAKRVQLIRNSLKTVNSVYDIVNERLDVIGVPLPPT